MIILVGKCLNFSQIQKLEGRKEGREESIQRLFIEFAVYEIGRQNYQCSYLLLSDNMLISRHKATRKCAETSRFWYSSFNGKHVYVCQDKTPGKVNRKEISEL